MEDSICHVYLTDEFDNVIKYYDVEKDKLFGNMDYFRATFSFEEKDECKFDIEINDIEQVKIYDLLFEHLNTKSLNPSIFTEEQYLDTLLNVVTVADYFGYESIIDYISKQLILLREHGLEIINLFLDNPILNPGVLDNALLYNTLRLVVSGVQQSPRRLKMYNVIKKLLQDSRVEVEPSVKTNEIIITASRKGFKDVIEILLQYPNVDPSSKNNMALKMASFKGFEDVVELLIQDSRVDPSSNDNIAIINASKNGYTKIVKLLLQDPRVDPSYKNNAAIVYASENGHVDVVRLLLQDSRVDPSDEDNIATIWASENGHVDVVKLLIDDPRVFRFSGLLSAIRNGYIDIVKLLISEPKSNLLIMDIGKVWIDHAINEAFEQGYTDIAKLLLEYSNIKYE